jgi:hypothetical protein
MQTTPIEFLSPDYFALVAAHPELADAFALGEQVIALSNGVAYKVVPTETPTQPVNDTPTPSNPNIPTSTPVIPTKPTQTPTQVPTGKPSGLCGAAFMPLILVPLLVVARKKTRRNT